MSVPALRFKDKAGQDFPDWHDVKLGEIGRVLMCKRILKEQTQLEGDVPFYKIGTFGKQSDAYISFEVYKSYKEKFSFPKKGDILISAAGTIGRTVVYDGLPAYFQDSNIVWIDNNERLVKNAFLYYLYANTTWNTENTTIARLYNDNLKSILINFPTIDEQAKIANFLTAIDEKITLLTQKHDLLTQYKKGVMQQIFSQELRFKDDDGQDFPEWKEKLVGEVFNDFKGTGLSKDKIGEVGKNKCILYGHLFTRYSEVITDIESRTDFKEGLTSVAGDILMPSSTTTKGIDLAKASSLNQSGVLLGGDIIVLRLKEKGNSNFFAYFLTHAKSKDIAEITQGATIIHLYFSQLKNILLNYPCDKEQTKIANFLTALDDKITATQTQLQAVKQYKQGLLQQMFV